MDELILELIYPYLNFKMFHKLRITCKTVMDFTEKPYYWEVINFTDLPHHTFSNCLIDNFACGFLHVVNLTKKNNDIYSFPKNLLSKVNHIKRIII
tara:strand:+ start:387 stop:674 length:288 start_codon:yes stop_codon:yes gene_type:complete